MKRLRAENSVQPQLATVGSFTNKKNYIKNNNVSAQQAVVLTVNKCYKK